jgi:putative sterol carrier protein
VSDNNASDNQDPSPVDAGAIAEADASELAALASQASDEQLAEAMSDPENRRRVLDEIFGRMADHADPNQIKDVEAVVHFKIKRDGGEDGGDGGVDVYEAVIKDGQITINEEPTTDSPKMALTAAPVPFLKLVTGQESGPAMFMTGKLKIEGDLMFASRMTSFFRIPSAA